MWCLNAMPCNGTSKVSLLCWLQRDPLATGNSLLSHFPAAIFTSTIMRASLSISDLLIGQLAKAPLDPGHHRSALFSTEASAYLSPALPSREALRALSR